MSAILEFGETREEYSVPVLNERAVRAGAGILFFLAVIAFMNAWLTGNFQPTRLFVVAFLIDFAIRIFINPRFAPSLIVGQWMVRKQLPEWTGAPQKRFAWAIGFALALSMFYLLVLNSVVGPINMIVCATCLILLLFETAFGICIGCNVYNLFNKEKARLCPGGACDIAPDRGTGTSFAQAAIVLLFVVAVGGVAQWVYSTGPQALRSAQHPSAAAPDSAIDPAEIERCRVPAFAKAIGHEEMWKLHNSCG